MKINHGLVFENQMVFDLLQVVEGCIVGKKYPEKLRVKLEGLKTKSSFAALFNILRQYAVE